MQANGLSIEIPDGRLIQAIRRELTDDIGPADAVAELLGAVDYATILDVDQLDDGDGGIHWKIRFSFLDSE